MQWTGKPVKELERDLIKFFDINLTPIEALERGQRSASIAVVDVQKQKYDGFCPSPQRRNHKMKKTLLALATLSAMAGSALAADVTVYGLVDYGFKFTNVDQLNGGDSESTFEMKSGMNSGSRFGLKSSEDLGNGLKVGFVLENGFNADDGTLDNGGRLFGRESQLFVQGSFGTFSFGRMGQILSALGSYGLLSNYSVFGGGWGSYTGGKFVHGEQRETFNHEEDD